MAEEPNTIDPLFKLRNSPLQGVEAYRSPFYRRLLSAGYKGYIQGSLGGATLFAALGASAGVLITIGAAPFIGLASAFISVPIMAGAGLLYGKDAFGTIGAVAAISAEQAEMSERRRNLLDRYFETPSREEAKEIESQISAQSEERMPKKWFHWKAALLGAVVVGSAAVLLVMMPALIQSLASATTLEFLSTISDKVLGKGILALATSATPGLYASAAAIGALTGGLIGIDRAYIRKWFDVQERFHDDTDIKSRRGEHQRDVERLQQAYRGEGFGFESRGIPTETIARDTTNANKAAPISPRTVTTVSQPAGNLSADPAKETPKTTIQAHESELQQRAVNLSGPVAAL